MSVGSVAWSASIGGAAANPATVSLPAPPAHATGTPAAAAPARAEASNSGCAKSSAARESSRWYCTSGAESSTLSGTTVQPA